MSDQGKLIKLRNEIQALEWSLMRLQTGRKARENLLTQEHIQDRIRELRTRGQRIVAEQAQAA